MLEHYLLLSLLPLNRQAQDILLVWGFLLIIYVELDIKPTDTKEIVLLFATLLNPGGIAISHVTS